MTAKKKRRDAPLPAPLPVPAPSKRKPTPAPAAADDGDGDDLPKPLPIKPAAAEPAKTRQDDIGIPCRRCGCTHHWTIDVRRTFGARVRRRRECRHCGHQFVTFER